MSDGEWETEEENSVDEDHPSDSGTKEKQAVPATIDKQEESASIVPEFMDLVQSVSLVKASNPEFGQKRILAAIKSAHPQWAVSEKRLQKAIAECGSSDVGTGAYRSGKSSTSGKCESVPPVQLDENGPLAFPAIANMCFYTLFFSVSFLNRLKTMHTGNSLSVVNFPRTQLLAPSFSLC